MSISAGKFVGSKAGAGVWQNIVNEIPPAKRFYFGFLGKDCIFRKLAEAGSTVIGFEISEKVIATFWKDFTRAGKDLIYTSGNSKVQIFNRDFVQWITGPTDLTNEDFIYADPTYPLFTRKNRRYYDNELSDAEHEAMLDAFLTISAKVAISTRDNELYQSKLKGWRKIQFPAMTRGGIAMEETVYMNYPPVHALQIFSVFGENFVQRQAMQRKANRWIKAFNKMRLVQRNFILKALGESETINRFKNCENCGSPFRGKSEKGKFCKPACRIAFCRKKSLKAA